MASQEPIISMYEDAAGNTPYNPNHGGLEYDRNSHTNNSFTIYIYNNRSGLSDVATLDNPVLYLKNNSSPGWIKAKNGAISNNISDYTILGTSSDTGLSLKNVDNGALLSGESSGSNTRYAQVSFIIDPSSTPTTTDTYSFDIWVSGTYTTT